MSKEHFYIGIALLVAIVVGAFVAANMVSEKRRNTAAEELRTKAIAINPQVLRAQQHATQPPESSPAQRPETKPVSPSQDDAGDVSTHQDANVLHQHLVEKVKEMEADPHCEKALELINEKKWKDWTEEETALVEDCHAAHRNTILELRKLANSNGPHYELDYSKGFAIELPHLAKMRHFARLLAADAALAAKRSDYAEMLENYAAIAAFANSLNEEPILISQLVRFAINGIMYSAIVQTVRGEDLPPEVFHRIIELASSVDGRDGLVNSMATEGFFGLEAFEGVRTGDPNRAGLVPQGVDAFLMRFYGSALARPFLNMDEENYARTMNRMSDAVALPFYEAKPTLDQIASEIDNLPRTRVISHVMLPALTRVADMQARNDAHMGLLQVGLAVEQYHGEYGQYPETLAAVAPMLGGAMPRDPYTGQPFVYEPRRNGFTLYSPRGSFIPLGDTRYGRYGDAQGNIVWRGAGG